MDSLQLYYSNLPKGWSKYKRENFSISKEKFETLKSKLLNLPNGKVIYMQNACKLFIPIMLPSYKIIGINFQDYFNDTFTNEKYEIKDNYDLYCIYNVGLEKALNTEFSSRLLFGLIEQLKENDKIVVLCSHLAYNEFYKKYQIEIVNYINLREKSDEKIL